MDLLEFPKFAENAFLKIVEIINFVLTTIKNTTKSIDAVQFDKSLFVDYLGYFHYVVGTANYTIFMTIATIALGLSIFTFLLNGWSLIKELKPW